MTSTGGSWATPPRTRVPDEPATPHGTSPGQITLHMYTLATLALISILSSLLLTPLCRDIFLHFGFVDVPDSKRKMHCASVPRLGGVPIALTYLGCFVVLLISPLKGGLLVK